MKTQNRRIFPWVLLAALPLLVAVIQTLMIEFPASGLLGMPYSPWTRVLPQGLLLAGLLGLLLWLLARGFQRSARGWLRGLFGFAGGVLLGLSVWFALLLVLNEWWMAANASNPLVVMEALNPEALRSVLGQVATVPAIVLSMIWMAGWAAWLRRLR